MCIRVEQGKGGKDRYVPLSSDVLKVLRIWWYSAHPQLWLFAGQGDGSQPINYATAQKWYQGARARAGITKRGGIHTLCHCHATHLLEAGTDLHSLSQWLGHRHVSTTSRYLHLARPDVPDGARREPLNLLAGLSAATTGAAPEAAAGETAPRPAVKAAAKTAAKIDAKSTAGSTTARCARSQSPAAGPAAAPVAPCRPGGLNAPQRWPPRWPRCCGTSAPPGCATMA